MTSIYHKKSLKQLRTIAFERGLMDSDELKKSANHWRTYFIWWKWERWCWGCSGVKRWTRRETAKAFMSTELSRDNSDKFRFIEHINGYPRSQIALAMLYCIVVMMPLPFARKVVHRCKSDVNIVRSVSPKRPRLACFGPYFWSSAIVYCRSGLSTAIEQHMAIERYISGHWVHCVWPTDWPSAHRL